MVTLATSYPFLNILWTILIYMALVIWYRIETPIEQAKGLAHVPWLATRQEGHGSARSVRRPVGHPQPAGSADRFIRFEVMTGAERGRRIGDHSFRGRAEVLSC
jgi:hypothetical protein